MTRSSFVVGGPRRSLLAAAQRLANWERNVTSHKVRFQKNRHHAAKIWRRISDPFLKIIMTTTPPPPVVKSKSRFFGAQKSKPWENDEEQPVIEILSAPDERNVSPPQSPSNVAEETAIAPAEATTKENEVNLRLETEDLPKDDSSSNIFAKFAFGAAAAGSKSTASSTNNHLLLRNGRQSPLHLQRNRI